MGILRQLAVAVAVGGTLIGYKLYTKSEAHAAALQELLASCQGAPACKKSVTEHYETCFEANYAFGNRRQAGGIRADALKACIDQRFAMAAPPSPAKNKKNAKPRADEFVVKKPALVIVSASKSSVAAASGGVDASEAGADIGYYDMLAEDFARAQKLAVLRTNQPALVFVKKDGSRAKVKNAASGLKTIAYLFDGVQPPKMVDDIVKFPDGTEYKAYFRKAPKPKRGSKKP